MIYRVPRLEAFWRHHEHQFWQRKKWSSKLFRLLIGSKVNNKRGNEKTGYRTSPKCKPWLTFYFFWIWSWQLIHFNCRFMIYSIYTFVYNTKEINVSSSWLFMEAKIVQLTILSNLEVEMQCIIIVPCQKNVIMIPLHLTYWLVFICPIHSQAMIYHFAQ